MLVEVCVQNLEDALLAEREGADRIELCASLETGGITPSVGLISNVLRHLQIPVNVLVRPRAGGFDYTVSEMETVFEDIRMVRELGAHGIVTGVLKADNTIDEDQMKGIRQATRGVHLTFHRAFDLVPDPLNTISVLETIGVDTVLTSGQRKRAIDALDLLLQLKERSKRLTLMPGSGVRPDNIMQFKNSGFEAIHFSATASRSVLEGAGTGGEFSISDLGSTSLLIMQESLLREMIRSVK